MNFSGVKCDECGRLKGEANHWHQIGIIRSESGSTWIELGTLMGSPIGAEKHYSIHDLCGEQCFVKHIFKLLRIGGPLAKLDGTPEAQ